MFALPTLGAQDFRIQNKFLTPVTSKKPFSAVKIYLKADNYANEGPELFELSASSSQLLPNEFIGPPVEFTILDANGTCAIL